MKLNKKGDLKIDKKTVVNCISEELANKVLEIADKLGYTWINGGRFISYNRWRVAKEQTCYNLHDGEYSDIEYWQRNGYSIISAEKFISLHSEKPTGKVFYRGNSERGNEIIKALEELGGSNSRGYKGETVYYAYYINKAGIIGCASIHENAFWLLSLSHTEAKLPIQTVTINGEEYELTEEVKAFLSKIKPINKQ